MEFVEAPFTPVQVWRLNKWQRTPWVHPFTCPNRSDGNHRLSVDIGDLGVLHATNDGWICQSCDYTQNWAHAFMANESTPPNPLDLASTNE